MKKIINVTLGLTLAFVALYNVSALSGATENSASQLSTDYSYAGSGKALYGNSDGTKFCCGSGSGSCAAANC